LECREWDVGGYTVGKQSAHGTDQALECREWDVGGYTVGEQSENKLEETGDEGVVDRNNTCNS
jgi:hypothetical protein